MKLTENQIYYDLFNQFSIDDDNNHYSNPYSSDVIGRNLMVMGLEALIFLALNILIELVIDEKPPVKMSLNSQNSILNLQNITKVYKNFREKFRAVNDLR